MELKKFWNKAIEFYCTNINASLFETVFIAISEESLERVKEKFIRDGGLTKLEIQLSTNNIDNVGGVINSYYSAIKDVHSNLDTPEEFSFLRFSIFVVVAFKQEDRALKHYWVDFEPFLKSKNIPLVSNRTEYINAIMLNLVQLCQHKYQKVFFQYNVFGEDTSIVNVGRIKAHSVFQDRTLKEIKKIIYILGYSETHNIEDLNYEDIELILKESSEVRILNLFSRDDVAKEIVSECLKIWLQNWIPNQEEKVKLLAGKISFIKSKLQVQRIWTINGNNDIDIKYGFITKADLGEDNIYYLNKQNNIYIDVAWGVRLSENRILYTIENYMNNANLDENELGFKFTALESELNKSEYALEKIPNRKYFIEHRDNTVKLKDNPILLASYHSINDERVNYFHDFKINNQQVSIFKLYWVIDSFNYSRLTFIKTSNLDIYPLGISDGRSGVKSFLSSFPILIKWNNLAKGIIQVLKDNIVYKEIDLTEKSKTLDCDKEIGVLGNGSYCIKFLNADKKYEYFFNGNETIDFEIVDSGKQDRRVDLKIDTFLNFEYHEFRLLNQYKTLEESSVIFVNDEEELKVEDKHVDFYFTKNKENQWVIMPNNEILYLQRTLNKPIDCGLTYDNWDLDITYLSKEFKKYNYKIKYCRRIETLRLPLYISKFYFKNEDCKINTDYIIANCYYYKLVEMDDELKDKYPNVSIGDEVFIISNSRKFSKPEDALKLVNQEYFPFKK